MPPRPLTGRAIALIAAVVSIVAAPAAAQPGAWDPDLEKAVFKVRAGTDAGRNVYARALGFLIGEDGLGITTFSTIQRAERAGEIVFEQAETALDFDLLAIDPASNLALVRIDLTPIPDFERPAPLRFRPDAPAAGESIHILGDWRLANGSRRAVAGNVVETVRCAELPNPIRRATGCTPAAVWMRTDAPIHVTHSGGPVLDNNGDIVGLAAWAWTGNDTESLAIAGSELRGFVDQHRDAEPLNIARERRGWARLELGQSAFPILEIDQYEPVVKAAVAGRALRRKVPCPSCKGTHKVKEKRKVGESLLPGMRQSKYEFVDVACDAKGGTGYNDAFRIVGKGDRVGPLQNYIGNVALMDPYADNADTALRESRDELDKMMIINPVAWTNNIVNPEAKRRVTQLVPEVGTPIIAVGMLMNGRDTLGGLTPLRTVQLIEYRINPSQFMTKYNAMGTQLVGQRWWEEGLIARIQEPELIIHNPILVDAVPGEIVMVTGLLAGFVTDIDGVRQPVIQQGFIVTPRPDLAFDDDI